MTQKHDYSVKELEAEAVGQAQVQAECLRTMVTFAEGLDGAEKIVFGNAWQEEFGRIQQELEPRLHLIFKDCP